MVAGPVGWLQLGRIRRSRLLRRRQTLGFLPGLFRLGSPILLKLGLLLVKKSLLLLVC